MPVAPVGPCSPWEAIFPADVSSFPATGASGVESAVAVATEVLWSLSGRQFGTCDVVVRPCRTQDAIYGPLPQIGHGYTPYLDRSGAFWHNICGHPRNGCGCGPMEQIDLAPMIPAIAVSGVTIDGAPVDPAAYEIQARRYLVRLDGGRWPSCQDLTADLTEEGSFGLTLRFGNEVPLAGRRAVGELAHELLKASNPGTGECRLPSRISSVTRQGVTMTMLDPMAFLDGGKTGLYLVDLWLGSVNPNRLASRPSAWSPDRPPPHRVVS